MTDEELTKADSDGEIEEEKVFHSKKLGSFTFRLPYASDELNVLRRRTQIMGVPEHMVGQELLAMSHAQAMYETYNMHAPHRFDIDKMRSWAPFIQLMTEVGDWHQTFFRSLEGEEA